MSTTKTDRTLPTFGGSLQDAMRDCNCRTWEDAMKALVAGAVDYDDCEELVFCCGEVADLAEHKRSDAMPWSEAVGVALEFFRGTEEGSNYQAAEAQDIVLCGQIADTVRRIRELSL